MGNVNPFLGGAPVMPQSVGGSVPTGGDSDGATAVLGSAASSGVVPSRSTPATLGALLLFAAGVIVVIHIAGVRTHFTVQAGR